LQTDKKAKLEEQMNGKLVSFCSGQEWGPYESHKLFINSLINYSTAEVFDDGCCGKTCGDEEKPLRTGVVKILLVKQLSSHEWLCCGDGETWWRII